MLNISPIGRSCTLEERIEFSEIDKVMAKVQCVLYVELREQMWTCVSLMCAQAARRCLSKTHLSADASPFLPPRERRSGRSLLPPCKRSLLERGFGSPRVSQRRCRNHGHIDTAFRQYSAPFTFFTFCDVPSAKIV